MTDLIDPLVPADCDLRDFAYMPLDVVRLRDSNLSAMDNAEAFRAAVISWCVAWHQCPAASLPDDDTMLCRLLGYGRDIKAWRRLRDGGALHGWIKCSDGRLYHPVVAEKAVEAWERKHRQRIRGAKGAQVRWSKDSGANARAASEAVARAPKNGGTSNGTSNGTSTADGSGASNAQAPPLGMLGDGKGEERRGKDKVSKKDTNALAREVPDALPDETAFERRFWPLYPRKDDKGHARKAFVAACRKADADEIIRGLGRYRFSQDPQFVPHAATWLNGERWLPQQSTPPPESEVQWPPAPSRLVGGL